MSKKWLLPPGVELKEGHRYRPDVSLGYRYFSGAMTNNGCLCGGYPGRHSRHDGGSTWVCMHCSLKFTLQVIASMGVTYPRPYSPAEASVCQVCGSKSIKCGCFWGSVCAPCDDLIEKHIDELLVDYEPAPSHEDLDRASELDALEFTELAPIKIGQRVKVLDPRIERYFGQVGIVERSSSIHGYSVIFPDNRGPYNFGALYREKELEVQP
ncbi:hypothetical protein Q0M94_28535 (plasmid) [Deinococcus radiomollis]|uniref:hypothetical protein n=1 Tax=Deinococcus radiomollis TaxID=468916 RepID=UPI003891B58C